MKIRKNRNDGLPFRIEKVAAFCSRYALFDAIFEVKSELANNSPF